MNRTATIWRALWLLIGVAAVMTWISPAAAAKPVTLVSTQRPITEFVQDNDHVAWSVCPGVPRVSVRALSTGSSRTYDEGWGCDDTPWYWGDGLALARSRVLWAVGEMSELEYLYQSVFTAALPDPDISHVQGFSDSGFAEPMAGAGDTLVYGFGDYSEGGIKRVQGGRAIQIPGAPRPAILAVGGRRIVLAPALPPATDNPAPAQDGPVEVRDAFTGALVTTFHPAGTVLALALTRTTVAALVEAGSGPHHIERYSVTTGSLVGSTWVRRTAWRLDMSGSHIVYENGSDIRLLDAETGARRLLRRTRTPLIIGVSIEGRRVAWAVNRRVSGGWRGKIRALWLERRS